MELICVECRQPLLIPTVGTGQLNCPSCGFVYHHAKHYLRYDFDPLLYSRFAEKYLLWKALGNNGLIAYHFLRDGSLSVPGREDVDRFKRYIQTLVTAGRILDIGCGLLPMPGYLDFEDKTPFDFYGLDPIDDDAFRGYRVTGCSEFTPFPDDAFDAVIFATSLDHVCSLERTLTETWRILKPGGKVFVWMGDRKPSSLSGAKRLWEATRRAIREGEIFRQRYFVQLTKMAATALHNRAYQAKTRVIEILQKPDNPRVPNSYVVYPNHTVLYIPKGAVDPFHSYFEGPVELTGHMATAKFRCEDLSYRNTNEVFLTFSKTEAYGALP